MAQKTAVDFYIDKMNEFFEDASLHCGLNRYGEIYQQAKQMEKQQLANTWDKACDHYIYRDGNLVKVWEDFDKYYNETYGSNNQI